MSAFYYSIRRRRDPSKLLPKALRSLIQYRLPHNTQILRGCNLMCKQTSFEACGQQFCRHQMCLYCIQASEASLCKVKAGIGMYVLVLCGSNFGLISAELTA